MLIYYPLTQMEFILCRFLHYVTPPPPSSPLHRNLKRSGNQTPIELMIPTLHPETLKGLVSASIEYMNNLEDLHNIKNHEVWKNLRSVMTELRRRDIKLSDIEQSRYNEFVKKLAK